MTNNYVLAANNIGYSINNTKLFQNINFEAKKGESIHIKGSNGSGKTTPVSYTHLRAHET